MKLGTVLFNLLAVSGLAAAADKVPPPSGPPAPGLEYLYRVNITAGSVYPIGQVPLGLRLAVTIAGGSFAGPKLKGSS
jgi:uncharacterized protein DUF3237